MPSTRFDVLGIGNAIVDVIARTEEDFLLKQGMHKGTMALIDEPRAQAIYDAMGPAIETSGGSAANTIVGVAGFGDRHRSNRQRHSFSAGMTRNRSRTTSVSPSILRREARGAGV